MKRTLYIYSLVLILSSCTDFLDTKPLSFTSISNFYRNQDDAELALTGCYGLVGSSYAVNYRTGLFLIGDVGTDEIISNPYSKPDPESNMDQFLFGRIVKSNLNVKDIWARMYTGLYSLNILIDKIDDIEMDNTSRKAEIKAEAMFLRGWHYMYLGMIFGGVPVYTTVPQEIDKKRNTLEEVMKQSISDFQYAYDNLPAAKLLDSGRATKWAAAGYLSKLYCYLASCKKYEVGKTLNFPLNSFEWVDIDNYYQKADTLTSNILVQSGLSLAADYRLLFCEGSKDRQKEECLFSLSPSTQKKIGFGLMYYLLPPGSLGGGWGTCRPTQEVYSRYDTLYDSRSHWVVGGLGTQTTVELIDNQVYYKPTKLKLVNGQATDGDYSVNKFRILKTDSKHDDVYYGNYPLLRLADIYLLRAEALAHINGDEAGREILKSVRSRALDKTRSTDVTKLQTSYRKTDFIQELLDERSRELCFEQQRKFDLIRFNKYQSTIKSLSLTFGVWNRNGALQLVDNITDTKIWCPIPEEDEIANPNLKPNNPGY